MGTAARSANHSGAPKSVNVFETVPAKAGLAVTPNAAFAPLDNAPFRTKFLAPYSAAPIIPFLNTVLAPAEAISNAKNVHPFQQIHRF